MRRIFIVPNMITAFGLSCGLFVIFKVNMIEPGMSTYKSLMTSTFILLLAALADWFDGAVARMMHAESEFGFLFDSLSDAVTFGVAPTVIMLKNLSLERGTPLSFYAVVGAMVFSICGILRLVRFNVTQTKLKKLPKHAGKKHRHFTGFPIPAAALMVVATNLLFAYPPFIAWAQYTEVFHTLFISSVALFLGYCMICRFKFPSAKVLHFRVPSFQFICGSVIAAFFLLYGLIYFFPITLAAAIWAYFLLGWTLALIRMFVGKKSKTLADFEPNHDDL